ncbi:MAG: DinB family protein [Phycisphaerales bacterium]|nr:DinB family protein [Phycisphaerales bacterium]
MRECESLIAQVRQASIAGIKTLSESDLDKPTGLPFAPTVGLLLSLMNGHAIMHLGQIQVIRRKLGKPIIF